MESVDLSVVIVAKNEEANIARCIESVQREVVSLHVEILLVDSASTDRTAEIASRHGATVLRLDPRMELSASAGRFVGAREARGDFILFLDADMVLIGGWLTTAMKEMADESVAAVGGMMYRVFPGEELTLTHPVARPVGRVASLGGAALYRAQALVVAGGFNPFVKGEEERELAYRLSSKGYVILRTETPMVCHMEKERTVSEVDEKASHFQGVGQILRAYPGTEVASDVLRRHGKRILLSLAFCSAVVLVPVVLYVSGSGARLVLFLTGMAVLGWLKIKQRLWKLPLFARSRVLLLSNLFRGWLRGIPHASTYDVSVSVILPQDRGV